MDSTAKKTAVIITGPESTGSTLTAQIVAHALGLGGGFQEWHGRGLLGEIGDELLVLHRSMPYGEGNFLTLRQYEKLFDGYELKFVLCTRDRTIAGMSNMTRRDKTPRQQHEEVEKALGIMKNIMSSGHPVLVWSYETFMLLKGAYTDVLCNFLNAVWSFRIEDDFFIDGNVKFIERINKASHYYSTSTKK